MFVLPVSSSLHRRALRGAPSAFAHLLADRAFNAAADEAPHDEPRVPRIDVLESDAAYSVVLDMAGAVKEQLKVSVEGRRVIVSTVAAATPETAAPAADASRVIYRERSAPNYARTVVLPAEVDQSASQARFENGVLTLTLAKRVPAGATQISINCARCSLSLRVRVGGAVGLSRRMRRARRTALACKPMRALQVRERTPAITTTRAASAA